MKAAQVRTVIITNADLVALQAALDKFRGGAALTAIDSGVIAYDSLGQQQMVGDAAPQVFFDGFSYVVFLFVTSG